MVEVALQIAGAHAGFAVAERVDVDPELASHEVTDGLVVGALCIVERQTAPAGSAMS